MLYYRTEDGLAVYAFSLARTEDGNVRIYIEHQPSYQGRHESEVATHRLHDERGPYICWAGEVRDAQEARAIAATWADNTQNYIRTGRFADH